MTPPDDNNSDHSSRGNGEYRANRWSNPSGGHPSFGATPQNESYSAPGAYPPEPGTAQDSFFSALFDFGFTRYATPSIIKFAYALGFVFIALMWVGYVLFALFVPANEFGVSGLMLGLFGVLILSVGALFLLMSLRMMMEFYLSNIRIAQSAQSIDQRLSDRGGRAGQGGVHQRY